jgi:hypothetical protein
MVEGNVGVSRLGSRGRRIVVHDRDEPIAEIGPPRPRAVAITSTALPRGSRISNNLTILR